MVKQLKNRYNDPTIYKRFVVGIDRAKMRLYDCEQTAQNDLLESKAPKRSIIMRRNLKSRFDGFKF